MMNCLMASISSLSARMVSVLVSVLRSIAKMSRERRDEIDSGKPPGFSGLQALC